MNAQTFTNFKNRVNAIADRHATCPTKPGIGVDPTLVKRGQLAHRAATLRHEMMCDEWPDSGPLQSEVEKLEAAERTLLGK